MCLQLRFGMEKGCHKLPITVDLVIYFGVDLVIANTPMTKPYPPPSPPTRHRHPYNIKYVRVFIISQCLWPTVNTVEVKPWSKKLVKMAVM